MTQTRRTSQSLAQTEDPKALHDARALLAKLLPVARGRAKEITAGNVSPVMAEMKPYATVANMLGVFIYQTADGWYADLGFRRVPQGMPGLVGNPANNPYKSRREALDGSINLISALISMEDGTVPVSDADPTERVFQLDDVYMNVRLDLVEAAGRGAAAIGITVESARTSLALLLQADFGDQKVTQARLSALDQTSTAAYVAIIAVLLANGVFRYTSKEPPVEFYEDRMATTKKPST